MGFIDAAIIAVSKNDLINGSGGTFPARSAIPAAVFVRI